MNVGLNSKRNIPLITNVFEGDTGYINIDKNTSNLIMNIPLFNEDEMGLSLVYSFLDRERNSICGKGLNLSFMKTISSAEFTDTFTSIEITNEDYSKVTYNTIYNDGLLKNNNVDNYIVLSNNDGENYSEVKLYDKNNNYYLYNLLSEQPIYPCKYHKATDESDVFVNFLISSNNLTAEYKNKKIEINMLDGKIDKIYYKVNNVVYSYCELIYSNDFLSRIKKYISYKNEDGFLYNTLVSDKEYVFNNTSYIMSKNLINGYYSKYYLFEHTANKYLVNKYVNSYQNEDHKNVIEYVSDKEVKVTDYKGNYVKHYLENGRIIYTVDNRKNIINYEYDTEGRMLKAIGPININSSVNNNKNNLLKNINSSDISYSISLDENNKVSLINDELHILGTENFEISIEKSIDINSQTGLTFLAEIEKSDSNNNLEIDFELYFNVNNSDVIRRSVNGLVLTSFVSKDNFSKVFLFITVPANSGQFVIKNIQLFNNIYGSIYEYDSSGLLIKQYNNSTTREYRYFTDNYNVLVNNRINNNNSCIYNYDYRNRVKEILYANGCSYHYEYDGNKLVRTVFKDNKGNFIEEKKSYYITQTKPYKIINSLGEVTYIDYDQNERIITNIRKENSYKESYLYNNDLTIKEKQFYVTPNNKIANKYYYDEKRRLEKIVLNDSYSIKYYYDDYNNITSVGLYNNDGYTAFEKSEYEVTSENIYTGNLKTHRIGKNISNDNKYLYEYDNCDRLTKVYISNPINNTLINEFEYDLSNKDRKSVV